MPITGSVSNFDNIKDQVEAAGYANPNRKFIIMADFYGGCGIADLWADDQPDPVANANVVMNSYSVIWKDCWNYGEPHELMHMLGGVQWTAPHTTGGGHCRYSYEQMCYNDGGPTAVQRILCANTTNAHWKFDCGDDDYFAYNPASTYLQTHWNAANSPFLQAN